jgi:hypothetical protein
MMEFNALPPGISNSSTTVLIEWLFCQEEFEDIKGVQQTIQ